MLKLDFLLMFILAHLIGDFSLQTNSVAKLKSSGLKGLIIHSAIVTAAQVLLLAVYGLNGAAAGLIGGVVHFFLDYLKSAVVKYFKNKQTLYFLIDQAMHVAVIVLLTLILAPVSPDLKGYLAYINILISLIIVTFTATVTIKTLLIDIYPYIGKEGFFRKYERLPDALAALVLWGIWFLPLLCSIIAIPVLFYFYVRYQKIKFDYSFKASFMKFMALSVISSLTFTIF